jgi:DNA-binding IclR family transcriptional regulator
MSGGERDKKSTKIIHALDKGLTLLELIENETYPVTLHTLWKKLGWDKATILRMCNTLENRGYLRRDPNTKQYSLGFKIFGLYESIVKNIDIPRVVNPYLKQLSGETGESAHLAFIFEKSVVFMDKVLGLNDSPINVQIGGREPLHCTALGKAFLAFTLPEEDREAGIEEYIEMPLPRYTRNTIVRIADLARDLEKIRERGFAVDNEEYIEGVRCIASPLLDNTGKPTAVIGLSAPSERVPPLREKEYGLKLKKHAKEISRYLFGHEGK